MVAWQRLVSGPRSISATGPSISTEQEASGIEADRQTAVP
jgi:hypothetical protein